MVAGFGEEWTRFNQHDLSDEELRTVFEAYFRLFPWDALPADAVGIDIGCGSGRWAKLVAPRVGRLHCIDPSPLALDIARRTLADIPNCEFHVATADTIPLPEASVDFAYCLGVLHHVPDPHAALRAAVKKLRPGAPLLVYVYYAFDNRPAWYQRLWSATNVPRYVISRIPIRPRVLVTQLLAAAFYWPTARLARFLERCGKNVEDFPLAYYRHRSFYVMRTDAFDRFGTRLEKRFTKEEAIALMTSASLEGVEVASEPPYWCLIGHQV